MPIATVNPATGELIEEFAAHTKEQVGQRLTRAEAAAATLRATDFDTRARWMRAAADLVEADTARTARMLTIEMGKPIAQARAEVLKCARAMRFYADNAESLLADQPLADPSTVQASAAYNPGGQTRSAIQGDCVPGWRSSGGLRSGDGLGHPAVDTQDLTGHVGGVVGRQEGGHGTDLGGVGPAVEANSEPLGHAGPDLFGALALLLAHGLGLGEPALGLRHSGGDRVDPDVAGSRLGRQVGGRRARRERSHPPSALEC